MGNLLSRSTSQDGRGSKRSLDSEDNQNNKRARFDDEAITIKESDVGIIAYVNPHLKGFHSILKYRYASFFFY
jgi:tRNA pseudouridine13 synthase